VENILSKKSLSTYHSPIESSGLNNFVILKAISKECKVFFERQKNPPEKGGGTQGV
jgi:hypothetical protein